MDNLTKEQRRKNMKHIRSKDTSIELLLRKAIWSSGIRYRKNYRGAAGCPDIAITKYKIAVFCDSSFFHGRDFGIKKMPETNSEYWRDKILRNMSRDADVNRILKSEGWKVLRFWDFEIKNDVGECVQAVKEAIFDRKINS